MVRDPIRILNTITRGAAVQLLPLRVRMDERAPGLRLNFSFFSQQVCDPLSICDPFFPEMKGIRL